MPFQRVAILGCGLIGGSFALALKKHGFTGEVVGWDRDAVLRKAERRGAIDRGTHELREAVGGADLIYLATPVVTILDLLPRVGECAKAGALVTDTGSTKARICKMAREVLPKNIFFLGGHPLAGKETSGIENADADLFAGAKYVVITEAQEAGEPQEFLGWVRKLGAEPVLMDAETHDWAVALVSHLPQLLSTALASTVWEETDDDGLPLPLAASGFRDMTRLAGSPYEIWRDICLTNSENIGRALERLEQKLEHMRAELRSRELGAEFEKALETYSALRKTAGRKRDE